MRLPFPLRGHGRVREGGERVLRHREIELAVKRILFVPRTAAGNHRSSGEQQEHW